MKNKNAFSLVEIITATGILTLTVFGIYRLIGENNKIVANSNNFLTQNIIFENVKECLKGQNFTGKKFLNFGNDLKKCEFTFEETFTKIDGIDYFISIEPNEKNFKIKIESSAVGILEKEIKK